MTTNVFPSKIAVRVVPKGFDNLPLNFPWVNTVHVSLMGNMSDLKNIQRELDCIKQLVNKDISKFGLNLKNFKIEITKAV